MLAWIDICAAVCAQRHCQEVSVTASMDDVHFHSPIGVGEAVTLRARVIAAFHTSMEVGVTVTAENLRNGKKRLSTSALLTFVALRPDGARADVPPLAFDSDAERAAQTEAQVRRDERLARRGIGRGWQQLLGS